jgi:hypothetical protein
MALTLSELLRACGFVPNAKRVKLVRHSGSQVEPPEDIWLEAYQRYQSDPVFDGCDQIVTFLSEGGSGSRFIGVYDVGAKSRADQQVLPAGCPPAIVSAAGVHYDLIKRAGFEDLENRVVIDWGKSPLAWHQWFTDRPVLEIRRKGRALPPFRDYLDFRLSHAQLVDLIKEPKAHPDWSTALSSVGGIYLIVDSSSAGQGQQYVGSATGTNGLWQRWAEYAKTGHGGNKLLREACKDRPQECPNLWSFSILDTFSRNLSVNEARDIERRFKEKLGTRAFGLNGN